MVDQPSALEKALTTLGIAVFANSGPHNSLVIEASAEKLRDYGIAISPNPELPSSRQGVGLTR